VEILHFLAGELLCIFPFKVYNFIIPGNQTVYNSYSLQQKPNSCVQFHEVSGHIPEIYQTQGLCMDFLNHRKGGMLFYQVELLFPLHVQ
jgi:hypothetical protein